MIAILEKLKKLESFTFIRNRKNEERNLFTISDFINVFNMLK
jgi:hypothetical protein